MNGLRRHVDGDGAEDGQSERVNMQIVTTNPNLVEDAPGLAERPYVEQTDVKSSRMNFLDRPLASFLRLNWETTIWIAILLVGAIARFVMLDVRAMSHDESLHTLYD